MPTEFTRAVETLNELDIIVTSYKSIDDDIYLSKYYDHILELQANINNSISKFQNRITTGIYNSNMTAKVNDMVLRYNVLSKSVSLIKNDYDEYKRNVEQEEQEEMINKKKKLDDVDVNDNTSETTVVNNTTTTTNIDNKTVDNTIASVTTTTINTATTNNKAVETSEIVIESEAISSRLGTKMLSVTYATNLVQAIARSLDINLEQGKFISRYTHHHHYHHHQVFSENRLKRLYPRF